ncbi:hypothetical protein ABT095_06830 [Kitasatospora sp. NPDC002227]|uniref:hypothetical protein n=1 Tax=Kitasatospora sp. NPDC002227 TaxID=3154773 RepID=UPI00331D4AB2
MTVRRVGERQQSGRRHGRPGPVGGRFALPSLRFSGAAMAMSTVLGISAATTWLVSTQQQIGRQDTSAVGGNPPENSTDPAGSPSQQAMPGPRALGAQAEQSHHPEESHRPSPSHSSQAHPSTAPAAGRTAAAGAPVSAPAVPIASPSPTGTGSPSPSPSPSAPGHLAPTVPAKPTAPPVSTGPTAPIKPTAPTPPPAKPAPALSGQAARDELGASGTVHTLTLHAAEPLTAVQVELRLARPEALPGTTPWCSVPDAVVTLTQDRSTIVYRFTLPALQPGDQVFGVRSTGQATTVPESWAASGFAPDSSRALAVRGTF